MNRTACNTLSAHAGTHTNIHNAVRPYRAPRWPHGGAMLAPALFEKQTKPTTGETLGPAFWHPSDLTATPCAIGKVAQIADTQEASRWPQEGTRVTPGTPSWPKMAAGRLQGGPKSSQEASRWHNMAPRRPKEDPRGPIWPIAGPRWLQACPKDAQTASQESPTWPKLATRWPQEEPKKAQDGPKRAPRMPTDAQGSPTATS